MKKISKFIFNNYGLILVAFFLLTALIYSFTIFYKNVLYFNNYLEGTIVIVTNDITNDPDAGSGNYVFYRYKIKSGNKIYNAKDQNEFKVKDGVFCIQKGNQKLKILSVNNKKINDKYSLEDLFSLTFLILFVIFMLYKILVYRRKLL